MITQTLDKNKLNEIANKRAVEYAEVYANGSDYVRLTVENAIIRSFIDLMEQELIVESAEIEKLKGVRAE